MSRMPLFLATLAALSACFWSAPPALAVVTSSSTWIASNGNDANTSTQCARANPCKSMTTALTVTADGGTLSCLDATLTFGAVIFTQSVTIDCSGSEIFAESAGDGVLVSGPGIIVALRGLRIYTATGFNGNDGVNVVAGANVLIENCKIYGFTADGIRFAPTGAGSLTVVDSTIYNNGSGSTGGGIIINPQSSGSAQVTLDRVTLTKNVFGIVADGTGSSGGINMTIVDSVTNRNAQDGIIATTPSGGAPIGVMVKNTKSVVNGYGIRSFGPGVTVRASGSAVIGNGTGLSFGSGGALLTFGNNEVQANGANGAFSGSAPLQ